MRSASRDGTRSTVLGRVGVWLARGLAALCCVFGVASISERAEAAPFSCTGDIYQVQSGQLRIFDPITSTYTNVGAPNGSYNATGYNVLDNYAYGSQGNRIIRIEDDGSITTLFNVGFSSFAGDVDYNNTLWLRRSASRYSGVNLATGAVTTINDPPNAGVSHRRVYLVGKIYNSGPIWQSDKLSLWGETKYLIGEQVDFGML